MVALIGTITAAVTGLIGYLGTRGANKTTSLKEAATEWNRLYNTLDEKLDEQAREIAKSRHEIEESKRRISALEYSQLRLIDYAEVLRDHIARDMGPPAPPWPKGIHIEE